MQDIPPPPPTAQEWPHQGDQEKTLRQEFQSLKEGLLGSRDFPMAGAINDLRREIATRDEARKQDVAALHSSIEQMPDTIIRKLNGTYVKADDLPFAVEAALVARRSRRWGKVGRFFGNETVKLLGGVAIAVIAALILGHVTGHL